jgi:23S rRNA (guanine745-N1)-methyltransferase
VALPVHDRLPSPVVAALRCPVCAGPLDIAARTLTCTRRHVFDVARQGHVDLRGPRGSRGSGDGPEMIARRASVLGAGHFDPLLDALVELATDHLAQDGAGGPGLVVDVGAGPGTHLARVLDALPGRHGLAIDVSKHAARRAALAHPRAGAVVADVWHGLPLADDTAAAVLDVFAPRHPGEFHRVLSPTGIVLLVTPGPGHLSTLTEPLGLLAIDPDKDRRLDEAFRTRFALARRLALHWTMSVDRATAAEIAGMGPGARHVAAGELQERARRLPATSEVEAAVVVTVYRPLDAPDAQADPQEPR